MFAGVTDDIEVEIKDRYGNTVLESLVEELEVFVYGPLTFSTEDDTLVVVQDPASGVYSVFFQTPVAGMYEVTVTVQGMQATKVLMRVQGGFPVGATSSASGPGLRQATAGVATSFAIYVSDACCFFGFWMVVLGVGFELPRALFVTLVRTARNLGGSSRREAQLISGDCRPSPASNQGS